MRRTSCRPLPAGRLGVAEGTWFGVLLAAPGWWSWRSERQRSRRPRSRPPRSSATWSCLHAAQDANVARHARRRGTWRVATGDRLGCGNGRRSSLPAIVLFGIVFFWQMPHFLAIAWMYRDDYAHAGIPLLPVVEPDGRRTGRQALLYAAALWPVSLMPALVGLAGASYSAVAHEPRHRVHLAKRGVRSRSFARVRASTVPLLDHVSAAAARSTRRRSIVALKKLPSSNSQLPKVFPW